MANFASKDSAGVVIPDKFTPTVRFNTHYSVQVDSLMGTVDVNAPLGVDGKPGAHYSMVENTCVGCHMGDARNHGFEPQLAACQACHTDAESIDVNGAVTAFEAKVEELKAALVAAGLMNEDGSNVLKDAAGNPVQLDPPQAAALFTYHLIEEDGSNGVHNPNYYNALVDAALAALQ
jgi:mono/diheme cytochrome c family protein